MVGRKEEQRGKLEFLRAREVFEMFKSVLKAQNGMNAELQLCVR